MFRRLIVKNSRLLVQQQQQQHNVTNIVTVQRFMSTTSPSVHDLVVNLTFIDPSGARRKTTGIVGTYYLKEI